MPAANQQGDFRLFPEAETVFRGDVGTHRRVLHPLLSLNVRLGSPLWSGVLHFVLPVEPWDGALGEDRTQFHGAECGDNWIKFSVLDSRYQFDGDFRYFKITDDPDDAISRTYSDIEQSYLDRKSEFETTGAIGSRRGAWLNQLGGVAPGGNWANSFRTVEDVQKHGESRDRMRKVHDRGSMQLINANGSPFHYVGGLTGYHYRSVAADTLHLFFDPVASEALIALDFT